jgi:hypothetical protein
VAEIRAMSEIRAFTVTSLYFTPKVTYPERFYGVKIMKIGAIENLTLGHLQIRQ